MDLEELFNTAIHMIAMIDVIPIMAIIESGKSRFRPNQCSETPLQPTYGVPKLALATWRFPSKQALILLFSNNVSPFDKERGADCYPSGCLRVIC